MKKVLVTGGAGFIGSHLVNKLVQKDYEVTVLDKLLRGNKIDKETLSSIELIIGDVKDLNTVLSVSKKCETIYHLAAILGVDIVADNPIETMETETDGMQNIATAAVTNGVNKIVYASTSGVYGHSSIEKTVNENIQVDPKTSYAIAKRFNEIYLNALYKEKGIKSLALRYFNVYGINQDSRMVIPRFFEQAMKENHQVPKIRYDYEVERRVGCSNKLLKAIGYKPTTTLGVGLKKIYKDLCLRN